MKKVLFTLAMVCFAFAANAQFVLGGEFGINTYGGFMKVDGDSYAATLAAKPNTFGLSINPRLGYQINEKFQVGVKLGFDYSVETVKAGNKTDLVSTNKTIETAFDFGLYGRYNCVQMGKFTLFAQLDLIFATGSGKSKTTFEDSKFGTDSDVDNYKFTAFGATLIPGVNYALNEKVSFDVMFNFIALEFSHMNYTYDVDGKESNVHNSFKLGADLDGLSIDDLTSVITVGFNYHF